MARPVKRTAGERRFRALQHKAESAVWKLQDVQRRMQAANAAEPTKQLRQMDILQEITEVIERLKA